jgi:hypothetical protein
VKEGFVRDRISLIAHGSGDILKSYPATSGQDHEVPLVETIEGNVESEAPPGTGNPSAGEITGIGAGVGAAVGGAGGLLIGLGALTVPGIGPVIAAGPLVAALAGAGVGAVAGGIIGALTSIGVPEEEASIYAEGVKRGGTLLTLRLNETDLDRAISILDLHDPVDVQTRSETWRTARWQSFGENPAPVEVGRFESEGGLAPGRSPPEDFEEPRQAAASEPDTQMQKAKDI